jgi:hypothetical protein
MVIKRTKPLDLPPDVAEAFAADMREFLVEKSARRREEARRAPAPRVAGARSREAAADRCKSDVLSTRRQDQI